METPLWPTSLSSRAIIWWSQPTVGRGMTETHESGRTMLSITWAETMKATALATATGQIRTVAHSDADVSWNWKHREVWLSRVRQSRERVVPPNPLRQGPGARRAGK